METKVSKKGIITLTFKKNDNFLFNKGFISDGYIMVNAEIFTARGNKIVIKHPDAYKAFLLSKPCRVWDGYFEDSCQVDINHVLCLKPTNSVDITDTGLSERIEDKLYNFLTSHVYGGLVTIDNKYQPFIDECKPSHCANNKDTWHERPLFGSFNNDDTYYCLNPINHKTAISSIFPARGGVDK